MTASEALKDVWFLDLIESAEEDDSFSRSMSDNKSFFDMGQHSSFRFNLSHSPGSQENKIVNAAQCTRSFKEMFDQPESSIFGIEDIPT